jgi:2-dehydro-3-deoxyphosphogluconate aldolase/(4S)-4-hydroxy-2-oxoglutarate aldolase
MERKEILDRILGCGIVAVVRGEVTGEVLKAVEAAVAGGIDIIEITFTVPAALEVIEKLSGELKNKAVVGAGTVLNGENAEKAIGVGAQFIVSPNTDLSVTAAVRKHDKPCMPGAFSPTEVYAAWSNGADVVKIFPASILGPGYLKALKGPFPDIKFMPTGGIDLENAGSYFQAGAACLAVGGNLISKSAMKEGRFETITENARKFREIAKRNSAYC